jgi:hypothetical protein
MKKLVMFLALAIGINTASFAENFEKSQHNFRVRSGDYGLELREEINSNKDHIQFSYFGIKQTEMRLRYVDNIGSKEIRPMISYMVYQNKNFFFRPRLDYRYFLGEKPDYFSFRTSFGTRFDINNQYNFWTVVNPIWDFGQGKTNDTNLDKIQFRLGVERQFGKLRFSPFIQHETDGHFIHTDTFLGTTATLDY